jgi:hypothetical protein
MIVFLTFSLSHEDNRIPQKLTLLLSRRDQNPNFSEKMVDLRDAAPLGQLFPRPDRQKSTHVESRIREIVVDAKK